MNYNEAFKKISWIYQMPEVFDKEVLSVKRLDELSEDVQKKLIYAVMQSLMKHFNYSEAYMGKSENSEERKQELGNHLTIWLSGLCNVSVAQIVHALIEVLDLKTEYQKWPPKSVMEFHAVCKTSRPAYFGVPKDPGNLPMLGWDKDYARERTIKSAHKCFEVVYKKLRNSDYKDIHEQKKKNGVYGEKMRT